MSRKPFLVIALALVLALIIVAVLLPPLRTVKKHGIRIQAVNSPPIISVTLTNDIATNRWPVSKP